LKITIGLNLYRLTLDEKLKSDLDEILKDTKVAEHLISFALISKDDKYLKRALKLDIDDKLKAIIYYHLGKNSTTLSQKALFFAQKYPQISYLIEYQLAKLYLNSDSKKAKELLFRAKERLKSIKGQLFVGFRESKDRFYDEIKPIYTLLIDILLSEINETNKNSKLSEIIEIAEDMKSIEIDSMFLDECLTSKKRELKLKSNEKIFYIIDLNDKVLVILKSKENLNYRVKNIQNFKEQLKEFRIRLQSRNHNLFLKNAQKFYDLLIRDFESELSNVKTLAFVLDGALRLIPPSTLHNGKEFLIERFNVSNLLSLALSDSEPLKGYRLFLGGISKAIDEFSPLPNVPKELKSVQSSFDGEVNLDENFTLETISNRLKDRDYNIIHFATHGVFTGEIDSTYLLTFNKNLTLNTLADIIKERNVDLITLSACQSAIGDERSSLGLAGVTIKSGSKSALASLWFVDDEATSILIDRFYKYLKNNSRGEALRLAKMDLIASKRFWHPSYWSAFILIGNWN
jgi:CHAT domain-containing protein